jgi:hypothetical protein
MATARQSLGAQVGPDIGSPAVSIADSDMDVTRKAKEYKQTRVPKVRRARSTDMQNLFIRLMATGWRWGIPEERFVVLAALGRTPQAR